MTEKFRIDGRTECLVGWDNPLQTFFGQVYRIDAAGERVDVFEEKGEEHDGTLLWVGGRFGEIETVADLVDALKPYTMPLGMAELLDAEND